VRSRRDEPVTLRQFYDRQMLLVGILMGLFGLSFVAEILRRLRELNGHHEEIKENQSRSVSQEVFDRKSITDSTALKLALDQVDSELAPLKEFRARAYGMAVILALVAAAGGAFLVKAIS
jgi:hypothetical protein